MLRLKYAAKGLLAVMLLFRVLAFLALQMATTQGRNVVLIIAVAAAFSGYGIFVLGLAHLTARERSWSSVASPLSAALSNVGTAVGTPALFVGVLVGMLFVEALLFSLGRVESFGEIAVSLLFMPAVILNGLLLLAIATAVWLGAALAAFRGTTAGATFKTAVSLLRAHAKAILSVYLAGFLATGLFLFAVWTMLSVALSLTLWTAQRAIPSYQIAMITGLPQLVLGALGSLGNIASALGGGTSVSMQIANLVFLVTVLSVVAVVAAYPAVLFSEVSMRICDAYSEAIASGAAAVVAAAAPVPQTQRPLGARCPQCHASVEPGSAFCTTNP
ncbi:MAG: hypothetical protein ACPL7M_02245 [Bryobacteraceae bacterium]